MALVQHAVAMIGNTPLVRINSLSEETGTTLLGKMEAKNPLSSVKDRIARSMIDDAEARGLLNPGGVIVEPTSGNTGIGLAFVAAGRGYRLVLTMPETMSLERRRMLQALGAELVLTPGDQGMNGAVQKAEELNREIEGSFMPQQFKNPANPAVHRATTGPEIWKDTDGGVDVFVAAVGTGGTITGVGGFLKEKNPNVRVVAVEPDESPVLSGGRPGPHKIQGIGAGFVPEVLDTSVYDEVVRVTSDEAADMTRRLARTEGIMVGISAGANVLAAYRLAQRPENKGKTLVTVLCDTGERYLSTWIFTEANG